MPPDTLVLAPFPALRWRDDRWEGFAPRPAVWQALRVESQRHLRGGETSFAVIVHRRSHRAPSAAQCRSFGRFLVGDDAVVALVLEAILERYRVQRERWLAVQPALDLPAIEHPDALRRMTKLTTVYVHEIPRAGGVDLGLALRTQWDPEHGAGVVLRGDRIVGVGTHDTAMFEARPVARTPRPKRR